MAWELIFFYLIATVSVLTALGVVAARNPVHSGVFLVICFLNVAGIFVMLGAEFLAVIQVIVYTGAILVLVLFVLMLVDPAELPSFTDSQPLQRYLGVLLGVVLLLEVGAAIVTRTALDTEGSATPANIDAVGGNTQAIGQILFSEYLLAFEVISLVLTVGILGAIVLAMPDRLGERIGVRRGTISLSHTRGTDEALPEGPRGETPIRVDPDRPRPREDAPRRVIMVTDPDERTTVGTASGDRRQATGVGQRTTGTSNHG